MGQAFLELSTLNWNLHLKWSFTRRHSLKLAVSALCAKYAHGASDRPLAEMTRGIPPRRDQAMTGSQFADSVSSADRPQREHAILDQLLEGNLPRFLRRLVPIKLNHESVDATIFVMPEYLAIGDDHDFLRIPMNLHTAAAIADRFNFVLPTKKMVDAIYDQSHCRFVPQPLPPGDRMTSTSYYRAHNDMIDKQSQARGFTPGALMAGHKKDVVLTNRLRSKRDRIAIYGWHRAVGDPIQPLSTVHGAGYADYSHGIRLVSKTVLIDGRPRPLSAILENASLATVLSDEGAIHVS